MIRLITDRRELRLASSLRVERLVVHVLPVIAPLARLLLDVVHHFLKSRCRLSYLVVALAGLALR